uniref:Alpha 1 protein n=1 Tax=Mavingoni virus TaxID=2603829 RepID=A0A5B9BJ99_9RHAB|nr:alpha 1 protein [Mavingoni virus]
MGWNIESIVRPLEKILVNIKENWDKVILVVKYTFWILVSICILLVLIKSIRILIKLCSNFKTCFKSLRDGIQILGKRKGSGNNKRDEIFHIKLDRERGNDCKVRGGRD